MEAKLIKLEDVYRLVEVTKHGNSIIGTTDLDYQKFWSDRCQKLSLKNCQAIERGYDLDELALKFGKEEAYGVEFNGDLWKGYIFGFQKAIKLIGDKKFSEEDVRKVIFLCCNDADSTEETIFESLQQTEWDVTFNPEELDADGCLILKELTFKSE